MQFREVNVGDVQYRRQGQRHNSYMKQRNRLHSESNEGTTLGQAVKLDIFAKNYDLKNDTTPIITLTLTRIPFLFISVFQPQYHSLGILKLPELSPSINRIYLG
jgi:hypothetical protein